MEEPLAQLESLLKSKPSVDKRPFPLRISNPALRRSYEQVPFTIKLRLRISSSWPNS